MKSRTNVSIDSELKQMALSNGLNLSVLLENAIINELGIKQKWIDERE